MPSRRPAFALIAGAALIVCQGMAMATDLTLHGWKNGAAASKPPASRQQQDARQVAREKPPVRAQERRKGKAAHADAEFQRRIVTYSLHRDPFFRFDGTSGAARNSDRVTVLGTGIGAVAVPVALPQAPQKPARPEVFRSEPADSAGIAFGCRERPFGSQNRREVTACFRHSVDRSWKAQTYVSRGIIQGTQTWGGGMSIVMDY